MRGGEACAPIWRWRRGLLAVSGMSPTPRELRRVYPGVYPGLETEGHASLMRSRRALGPARAPLFGTFGAVFSPALGAHRLTAIYPANGDAIHFSGADLLL